MGNTVEVFPDAYLTRALRGAKKCAHPDCVKPAIYGRGYCPLHVEPGRIKKRRKKESLKSGEVYIYAIECDGYIKIGKTISPRKRFASIQGCNPHELEYLGDVILTADFEQYIHDYLKNHNHRLEWFKKSNEVMRLVDMIVGKRADELRKLVAPDWMQQFL